MTFSSEHAVWFLSATIVALLFGTLLHPSVSPFHGAANFYVWHPVLMVSGFLFCISQGIVAYVADFGTKVCTSAGS